MSLEKLAFTGFLAATGVATPLIEVGSIRPSTPTGETVVRLGYGAAVAGLVYGADQYLGSSTMHAFAGASVAGFFAGRIYESLKDRYFDEPGLFSSMEYLGFRTGIAAGAYELAWLVANHHLDIHIGFK